MPRIAVADRPRAGVAVIPTLLLAQLLSSPLPTDAKCAPTAVKRIRLTKVPDPEWRGPDKWDKWCTGNACFVEEVLVTVNPDGTVKSAVVRGSWGAGPDGAALTAARNSKYIPATINCKSAEGTYVFREMFTQMH